MRRLALALALLAPSLARAQPASDAEATVARQEFSLGIEAARTGDWGAARAHFERSYVLSPRPSALFNLAGAQARTGALVAAAESYREYIARRSEPGVEGVDEAEASLGELEGRIPLVRVRAALTEGDEVTLDDHALAPALLASPIPVDPGRHRIAVSRGGEEIATSSFDAAEGVHMEVPLDVPAPAVDLDVRDPVDGESHDILRGDAVRRDPLTDPVTDPIVEAPAGENLLEAWWLWTIIGVVVVGAAVGIGLAVGLPGQPPESDGFLMYEPVRVP
ncbi:MAG: tol-pal system YbgF family protein [Sandaracinaceae bacterium]